MTRPNTAALAVLSLLGGSSWLLDAALPAALPGSLSPLIDNVLLTILFFALTRKRLPASTAKILAYSALLLAVPGTLASLAAGHLSSTTIVLLYTLVPAATIFFAAQTSQTDFLPNLAPALASIAGAALILPFAAPTSGTATILLVAILFSALAAASSALRLHKLLAGTQTLPTAALAAGASALIALPHYLYERPAFVLLNWPQALLSGGIHLALTAATLLLTVRLLRTLAPTAFSTRYFLIPLVTIAEGYFILHPKAPITLPVGTALLAGGSYLLLRPEHQA